MSLFMTIKGRGYPLVFFHGWGFDHKIWQQLACHMDHQYQLYLVDLPGFGLSSLMSWDVFKQHLLKRLPEQFVLVGWSMGGLYATKLAIEVPHRVTHLINIASSPRFIKDIEWPGIDQVVFNKFFVNLATNPQLTISQFVGLQLKDISYRYPHEHMPNPASLQEGLKILADWDLREPLHSFNKPSSFLFGRLDAITPRATMAVMQKIYPQFNYIMFNKAAHMPFLSDQHEFITVLQEILA